jgi:hypothetical protein
MLIVNLARNPEAVAKHSWNHDYWSLANATNVYLHGLWRLSRGKKPSHCLGAVKNPSRAFKLAREISSIEAWGEDPIPLAIKAEVLGTLYD